MDLLLAHGYFLAADPTSSGSCGRTRRWACCICRRTSRHAASTSASSTAPSSASRTSRRRVERERPPVVGIAVNLMTKRNALRMIAAARAAGAPVIVGGPDPPHHAAEYLAAGADVVVIGEGEQTLEELLPSCSGRATRLRPSRAFKFYGDGTAEVIARRPVRCCPISTRSPFPIAAPSTCRLPARVARAPRLRHRCR